MCATTPHNTTRNRLAVGQNRRVQRVHAETINTSLARAFFFLFSNLFSNVNARTRISYKAGRRDVHVRVMRDSNSVNGKRKNNEKTTSPCRFFFVSFGFFFFFLTDNRTTNTRARSYNNKNATKCKVRPSSADEQPRSSPPPSTARRARPVAFRPAARFQRTGTEIPADRLTYERVVESVHALLVRVIVVGFI